MPYVEATGAKLYFEKSGDGYPIIFIHEFASDIRGWEAQLRHFSRDYRCIAYNGGAIRRAMFPRMPLSMVGNSRSTTSPP
jgi:hypothetical protein